MSRTYKRPYTKSKRFDKTCRCHGSCSYCRDNRLNSYNREIERTDELIKNIHNDRIEDS